MMRKVRHALVQYIVKDVEGNPLNYEIAFRNQVVDIPEDQVERLDMLGATVAPDMDLERPGIMSALPDTASDAEITNWVIGASNLEVEALVRERPVMASRILSAASTVSDRFSEQNLHLGGLKTIAEEAEAAAKLEADMALLAGSSVAELEALGELKGLSDEEIVGLSTTDDLIGMPTDEADVLVTGTAKSVTDYISENPTMAALVLEAEGRRAAAAKEDPRVTIVRAAEAAAGFTQ